MCLRGNHQLFFVLRACFALCGFLSQQRSTQVSEQAVQNHEQMSSL